MVMTWLFGKLIYIKLRKYSSSVFGCELSLWGKFDIVCTDIGQGPGLHIAFLISRCSASISLTVVPHLAQPPCHSSFYSFIRGPPGPGVVVLVGDVDVDGVGVLAGLLSWREHSQPGHGGLLLCWANCLTQGPFSLSCPGVGEPGGLTFIWEL